VPCFFLTHSVELLTVQYTSRDGFSLCAKQSQLAVLLATWLHASASATHFFSAVHICHGTYCTHVMLY